MHYRLFLVKSEKETTVWGSYNLNFLSTRTTDYKDLVVLWITWAVHTWCWGGKLLLDVSRYTSAKGFTITGQSWLMLTGPGFLWRLMVQSVCVCVSVCVLVCTLASISWFDAPAVAAATNSSFCSSHHRNQGCVEQVNTSITASRLLCHPFTGVTDSLVYIQYMVWFNFKQWTILSTAVFGISIHPPRYEP